MYSIKNISATDTVVLGWPHLKLPDVGNGVKVLDVTKVALTNLDDPKVLLVSHILDDEHLTTVVLNCTRDDLKKCYRVDKVYTMLRVIPKPRKVK